MVHYQRFTIWITHVTKWHVIPMITPKWNKRTDVNKQLHNQTQCMKKMSDAKHTIPKNSVFNPHDDDTSVAIVFYE